MLECAWCGDTDCCERTDLRGEPVLCDECYISAKEFETEREADCLKCVHLPICQWCSATTSVFNFPSKGQPCEMCNTDFYDLKEVVSNAQIQARALMNKYHDDDREFFQYYKGRHDAFQGVMRFMSGRRHNNGC